jgi:hypothetical protein
MTDFLNTKNNVMLWNTEQLECQFINDCSLSVELVPECVRQ